MSAASEKIQARNAGAAERRATNAAEPPDARAGALDVAVREHRLKADPIPFAAVLSGEKCTEVRVNDRDFRAGDVLYLYEYDRDRRDDAAMATGYTGRACRRVVTHVQTGYGLPDGLVVLSLRDDAALRARLAAAAPVGARSEQRVIAERETKRANDLAWRVRELERENGNLRSRAASAADTSEAEQRGYDRGYRKAYDGIRRPGGVFSDVEHALRALTLAARTSGGVAGRDECLVAACETAEAVIARVDRLTPAPTPPVREEAGCDPGECGGCSSDAWHWLYRMAQAGLGEVRFGITEDGDTGLFWDAWCAGEYTLGVGDTAEDAVRRAMKCHPDVDAQVVLDDETFRRWQAWRVANVRDAAGDGAAVAVTDDDVRRALQAFNEWPDHIAETVPLAIIRHDSRSRAIARVLEADRAARAGARPQGEVSDAP